VVFQADAATNSMQDFRRNLVRDPNINARFFLIAKLFARAASMQPGEEKFLWLDGARGVPNEGYE
jgi:hypothetical protein